MLHVITRENRHLYTQRLKEMFRLRYRIFVEEQKWSLPCTYPYEMDQFDTEDAVYFIYIDESDEIQGSMRLLPTTKPHLMTDVFPELCSGPPPSSDDIYESSRGSVRSEHREAGRIWSTIVAGSYEFCLISGINQISFVVDMKLFSAWLAKGADINPLGPPCEINGSVCVAALREVSTEALALKRRDAQISGPALTYIRDLERAA